MLNDKEARRAIILYLERRGMTIFEKDYEGLIVCRDKDTIRFIKPVIRSVTEPKGFDVTKPDRQKFEEIAQKYFLQETGVIVNGSCSFTFDLLRCNLFEDRDLLTMQWWKNCLSEEVA